MASGPTLGHLLRLIRRMLEAGQPPAVQQELETILPRLEALRIPTAPAGAAWSPPPDIVLTPEQIACCDQHHMLPAQVQVQRLEREQMVGEFFLTCAIAVTHPCGIHRSEVRLLALTGPQGNRRLEPRVRAPARAIPGGHVHELFRFELPPNPGPEDVVLQVETTTLCGLSATEQIYPYKV